MFDQEHEMESESLQPESLQPWILDLRNVEAAKDLALEINPNSTLIESMYQIEAECPNEPWICVVGTCDICKADTVFFALAALYEDGIIGSECAICENMSVYPQERNSNEE